MRPATFFKSGMLFFICLLFAHLADAQYNVVKIDGLGLITNLPVVRVAYERSLSKILSVGLGIERGKYASTESGSLYGPLYETYKAVGWGIVPEARLYPFNTYKPAPVGFFIGGHARFRYIKEKGESQSSGYGVNLGLNTGYKVRMGQVVLDLVTGYGPSFGRLKEDGKFSFMEFEDKFRIEVSLGIVFPKIPRKDKSGKYLYQ
jgi:hypothetical protein